jgi:hypothetical protein
MRADTLAHPERSAPYCPTCVDNVVRLLDLLDVADAAQRDALAEHERMLEKADQIIALVDESLSMDRPYDTRINAARLFLDEWREARS